MRFNSAEVGLAMSNVTVIGIRKSLSRAAPHAGAGGWSPRMSTETVGGCFPSSSPGPFDVPHRSLGLGLGPFAYQGLEQARNPLRVASGLGADILLAFLKGFAAEPH